MRKAAQHGLSHPKRTGEGATACASAALARILSARNKFGSLRGRNQDFARSSPTVAGTAAELESAREIQGRLGGLSDAEGAVLRWPSQRQVDAFEQDLGAELVGLLALADRLDDGRSRKARHANRST